MYFFRSPDVKISQKKSWPGNEDTEAVELGIVDSVSPRPKFLPPSIPRDLADRIMRIHGDPIVWWVAQFLKVNGSYSVLHRPRKAPGRATMKSASNHRPPKRGEERL